MIVTLPADPDTYEPQSLHALLEPLVEAEPAVLDLRSASYVTSAVLSAIVLVQRRRKERHRSTLTLVNTSAFIHRILHAVQFDELVDVRDTIEDGAA